MEYEIALRKGVCREMTGKSPQGKGRSKNRTKAAKKPLIKKPAVMDERDFLDMIMSEANEEEAAEILGAPERDLWESPEGSSEEKK